MDPISAGQFAGAAQGALSVAVNVFRGMNSGNSSLVEASRAARVEPLLLVDTALLNTEYLKDVSQTMQNIFAGYYLMALDIIGNTSGINVSDKLNPLNPNSRPDYGPLEDKAAGYLKTAMESYEWKLPTNKSLAVESVNNAAGFKDAGKQIYDLAALSVGKIYEVKLKEGTQEAMIKIAIRLMANQIPSKTLTNMFSAHEGFDDSLKERFYAWRAGRIELWNDLILSRDLIERHRNTMIKDKTGIYSEIIKRKNAGYLSGALSGKPSMAMISNLAIISSETAQAIEERVLGKLEKYSVREKLMQNTGTMILAVVDTSFERVTFYHKTISTGSTLSIRDIKIANKDSDGGVSDILKALISGNSINL